VNAAKEREREATRFSATLAVVFRYTLVAGIGSTAARAGRVVDLRKEWTTDRKHQKNLAISAIANRQSIEIRMRTKTISDYPLLIGELIRRSELRKSRRRRRSIFFRFINSKLGN